MDLWLAPTPLVLASGSAIRRKVMEATGIPFEVRPASLDERAIEAAALRKDASTVAMLLAHEKASRVAAEVAGRLVVGADQVLMLEGRRLDKPADLVAARVQLKALAGCTHELYAGVAVARDGEVLFVHVDVARLTMRPLSDAFLDRYFESVGPAIINSVGVFVLEALGVHLFERIEGDYFTVLGLPLLPLLAYLRAQGSLA